MDMKYNLTCTTRTPGSAVVTSGYIGAGGGQPVPIEYLPAEHTLDSRVRLVIRYQERPTTTIAVGDPLQFKLETQEGENLLRDIFATNVVARDPYSDRAVELIDSRGCPTDPYVFPALGLARNSDGLETTFNAFKIPESNFLVFEATVRSCRTGCRPAVCDGPSGRDDSFGRRKKRDGDSVWTYEDNAYNSSHSERRKRDVTSNQTFDESNQVEVREMFRVYETRASIPQDENVEIIQSSQKSDVCLSQDVYTTMIGGLCLLGALLTLLIIVSACIYRRHRKIMKKYGGHDYNFSLPPHKVKNKTSKGNPQERYLPPAHSHAQVQPGGELRWQDPSEPIYTDPSMFERL